MDRTSFFWWDGDDECFILDLDNWLEFSISSLEQQLTERHTQFSQLWVFFHCKPFDFTLYQGHSYYVQNNDM